MSIFGRIWTYLDVLGRTWTYLDVLGRTPEQKLNEFVYELGLFLKLQPVAQNCARVAQNCARVAHVILTTSLHHVLKVSEVPDKSPNLWSNHVSSFEKS